VHRSRIIAGVVLIVVLGATVVLLVAFILLRRRTERALRRSHQHFQLIARATNDAVWDWDLTHDTLWWNEGYSRQLLLSRDAPQDFKTWESHLHPEDRAGIVQSLRETLSDKREQWSVEYRVVRADGEVRYMLDRILVERHASGRPLRLLGARLDLTDRKKAEQELLRLATAVHQCAEAIIILNPEGVISYVNPAFERITGFPPPQTLQLIYSLLRNPQTKPLAFAQIKERVRTTGQWAIRLEGQRRDGADCMLQAVVSPIRDREENIVNYVLVGQDVTRESKLEDQVRLAQKMEAVGQLAGGIAHDFNNLLQVIRSCANQALAAPGEAERQECLKQVTDTAAKAAQLTRQLLVFSRNEPTKFAPLNLNELLAQQRALLRRLLGARIEIDFRPAEPCDLVSGDAGQLEQVFMNLCINARDAMPQGGRITLEVSQSQLNETFCSAHPWARPGQYMQVVVTDNGSGMDKATLAKIFDPFFTTKAKDQGTGLGLAIVYGIVQKHEGLLHVYSEPGLGTSFRVYLPVHTIKAPSKAPFVSANPATPTGRTILLADDEAMVRTLAARILERAGHRVITASDGAEALAAFSARVADIHLVILDAIMPNMNGPEVFQQIRALAPDLPVLFCSGYSQKNMPQAFVPDAAVKMLAKPYDPTELLAMVNTLLSQPGPDRR
jgi:PAS domain S-box-containing protein